MSSVSSISYEKDELSPETFCYKGFLHFCYQIGHLKIRYSDVGVDGGRVWGLNKWGNHG